MIISHTDTLRRQSTSDVVMADSSTDLARRRTSESVTLPSTLVPTSQIDDTMSRSLAGVTGVGSRSTPSVWPFPPPM